MKTKKPKPKALNLQQSFFQKEPTNPDKAFFTLPQVQPKLEVGPVNDPAEREADAMADKVVNHAAASIQPKCADCEEEVQRVPSPEEEEEIQMKPSHEEEEEIQMKPELEEEELQMKSEQGVPIITNDFANNLSQQKGKGQRLPENTLQEMNQSFGADFSSVSVHTDGAAQRMSQQIQAKAFTNGSDIFFNKGQFNPGSNKGKHLLAHELTHVLQQNNKIHRDENKEEEKACPANTNKTWSEKVDALDALKGKDKNNCYKDLIQEALGSTYTIHESTNDVKKFDEAAKQENYKEWDSTKAVNYDANLNTKTGDANQYGQAQYVTADGSTKIYIVLGPNSINKVGPVFTKMAYHHEEGHANDYQNQIKNKNLHKATEGEELAIYTSGFTTYFLDLFLLDKSECSYDPIEGFTMLFSTYSGAKKDEQKAAFANIETWYKGIKGDSDKLTKFKIWFQIMLNSNGEDHPLVKKMNGLEGIGFKKGTDELDHFECTVEE